MVRKDTFLAREEAPGGHYVVYFLVNHLPILGQVLLKEPTTMRFGKDAMALNFAIISIN